MFANLNSRCCLAIFIQIICRINTATFVTIYYKLARGAELAQQVGREAEDNMCIYVYIYIYTHIYVHTHYIRI